MAWRDEQQGVIIDIDTLIIPGILAIYPGIDIQYRSSPYYHNHPLLFYSYPGRNITIDIDVDIDTVKK